ncbi:MAG: hypothetical protein IJX12_00225, partial [Lachnospiraceae bacterium]|nr:hypothetical protein [Lachnospiraceae bacterium]
MSTDATVTVNGSDEGVDLLGGNPYPASFIGFICEPNVLGTISSVDLTGVPEANIGDKAISYSATEAAYSVKGVWSVWNRDTKQYDAIDDTHTFSAGNIYKLDIELSLNKGYVFDYDIELTANGKECDDWYSNEKTVTTSIYASDGTPIEKVIIDEANFPKATIGGNFDGTPIEITVPENSGYTVEAIWNDSEGNESGTFEDGKAYYLQVYAYPEKGYYISDKVTLWVGDEREYPQYYDYSTAFFYIRQSFATEISEVVLKNLPERKIGATIPSPDSFFDIEVPEGAPYTATGVWYDADYNMITETEFKDGKTYYLSIDIEAKEGYDFADEIIITANDVKYKERKYGHTTTNFGITYSFADLIDRVEVTGVTEPKVGDTPMISGIKAPEGANYKIVSVTWYDSDDWNQEFTVFEVGHQYDLQIEIEPNDGYEFSNETEMYIDGEYVSKFLNSDFAYLYKTYSFKDIVSKIELIEVPKMQVGKVAGTKVTVPDGAPYTAKAEWEVWDDTEKEFVDFSGTFEAGKTYVCTIDVEAKNGYG